MSADVRGDNILNRRCIFCGGFCETMYDLNLQTSIKPQIWVDYYCLIDGFDKEARYDFGLNKKSINIGGIEFDVLPDENWW